MPAAERRQPAPVDGRRRQRSPALRAILVVDDNEDAAMTLAHVPGLLGHDGGGRSTTARGALAAAQGFAADVFLLDIGLPDMDGYELARADARAAAAARRAC